jgi:hypothetical protein
VSSSVIRRSLIYKPFPRPTDIAMFAAIVVLCTLVGDLLGFAFSPDLRRREDLGSWLAVQVPFALVVAALANRGASILLPPLPNEGGPGARTLRWAFFYLGASGAITMWTSTGLGPLWGPPMAGVVWFRIYRCWQVRRHLAADERSQVVDPIGLSPEDSRPGLFLDLIAPVGLTVIMLVQAGQLSAAVEEILRGVVEHFPGGQVELFGIPLELRLVTWATGLIFSLIVLGGFIRAISQGWKDFGVSRRAHYLLVSLPWLGALMWSILAPNLRVQAASTLLLLAALALFTDGPLDVAFSRIRAAAFVWRRVRRWRPPKDNSQKTPLSDAT